MKGQRKAMAEAERLRSLLFNCKVPQAKIDMLDSVIDNTAWMKYKLEEARKVIKTSNVVIPYDNGGGQKGLRENPLFKGYESLLKSYMQGLKMILDVIPDQEAIVNEELEKPKTMLELIRDKHKKEA